MNEIQTNNFDYSVLDSSTAEYLKDRENSMSKTLENTAEKLGEDLYKAQQELAKRGYGHFEEWFTSLGIKKTSAYDCINRYSFVRNLNEPNEVKTFQELGKSLKSEMSKPSADPEINQKVFEGEIKNHKDYVAEEKRRKHAELRAEEAERKAKEQADQLKQAQRSQDILQSKLDEAENREPEVIEKYSEPDDYQEIKNNLHRMEQQEKEISQHNEKLRQEIADMRSQRSDLHEKSKKYDELNRAINEMDDRLTKGQLRIKNQKLVYDLVRQSEGLIKEVSPLVYAIDHLDIEDNEYARKPLVNIIKSLEDIAKKMRKQLNEKQIIEVN